jgi:hypothetical protein
VHDSNTSSASAPGQAEIDQHVRIKEFELPLRSRLLAAVVLGTLVAVLANTNHFAALGQYSVALAGAAGALFGLYLGERVVFAILGGLVTYYFMKPNQ